MSEKARDVQCPKCNYREKLFVHWHPGHFWFRGRSDEHLDFNCFGCGYSWEMDCFDKPGAFERANAQGLLTVEAPDA